jgi:hypothetical protein
MRPALWRIHGQQQVFLTSMLTNVLGPGPAAIATALVPDLDHFRGSFGARGVIPLWLDPAGQLANVAGAWLEKLGVSAPELMAYCYALLCAPSYTRRFEDDLRIPGPRLPITRDRAVFRRAVSLGQTLIQVHTFKDVRSRRAQVVRDIGPPFPRSYAYTDGHVDLGEGRIGPVDEEVWSFGVSGYRVLPMWLRRRVHPRVKSPLDAIVPDQWSVELTRELLELVWLLEFTVELGPALDEVLGAAIGYAPPRT